VPLSKERKQAILEQFRLHTTDTGSPEVQIALLTQRIMDLTGHVTANKRDHASRRGLLKLVGQRRRLLDYLKRESPETYQRLIAHLDLRR
jgi:small subunit ribosomal protein S15